MFSTVGVNLSTVGDIMMHVGDEYSGGGGGGNLTIVTPMDHLGTVWSVIRVWNPPLKQSQSQQQIRWHYVGFIWDPFKRCFWGSFLSIVTAAGLSGIIWDPFVQVFSGSFHTVITTADLVGIVWSSI